MPKSEMNTRPDNRSQRRAGERIRKVMPKATETLGNASYAGVGQGRRHSSPGKSAQALREVAMESEKIIARRIAPKRGQGYNKGGYAMCGASNPPAKKR